MLVTRIFSKLPQICQQTHGAYLLTSLSYPFGRSNSSKPSPQSLNPRHESYATPDQKYKNRPSESSFQHLKSDYTSEYFENYKKQVQKDSVIHNFRKQIFNNSNLEDAQRSKMKQHDRVMDQQQNQLNRILNQDKNKDKAAKYSKKVMQYISSNRKIFKSSSVSPSSPSAHTTTSWKSHIDYNDYSAYKQNYVTIQDRNYGDMDFMNRSTTQSRTYQFLDSLPDEYQQKQQAKQRMYQQYPHQSADGNMSLTEFGKKMQQKHNNMVREHESKLQQSYDNHFKITKRDLQQPMAQQTIYKNTEQMADINQIDQVFQMTMLSSQVMNKIYDLYMQGWSIREISRRFGILPARAKFYVWTRARLYNQVIPKYGLKFYLNSLLHQQEMLSYHSIMDYGMDIQQMAKTQRYQEITRWENKRVDIQRKPEQYTQALQKLQAKGKAPQYDMVQVGTHGVENKKHLLKQWKIYRGKKSQDYFLKNKIFERFMNEKRKKYRNVYY